MTYEILNSAQVTPSRLYAFLRLIDTLEKPTREDVQNALQPTFLLAKKNEKDNVLSDDMSQDDLSSERTPQSASKNIYIAAKNCNLIEEVSDGTIKLTDDVVLHLDSIPKFRACMQKKLWNVSNPDAPNYLLNLYSAWYVVQNELVFQFEGKDVETYYNQAFQTDADDDSQRFNMTKFNGWRRWATFLGLGRAFKPGSREILFPDATVRLRGVLTQLFPTTERILSFSQFMNSLTILCPELDGGPLFLKCKEASFGNVQYGNYLSLALSTGLRTLHYANEIELIRKADATDNWQLYPAESHPLNLKEVTHIQLKEQKKHDR